MTSRADKIVLQLEMAFDQAVGAFLHQTVPGREAADAELAAALRAARDLGDVSLLACGTPYWLAALQVIDTWRCARADVREALTDSTTGVVRALARWQAGTLVVLPARGAHAKSATGGR